MSAGEYVIPEDLLYTKEHEWVKVVGERLVRVGITDYAQKSLKDIVFASLPEVGSEVKQGDVLGSVESVKAVSDVYSPVTGKVVRVNERLREEPELINKSPYDEGWIAELEVVSFEEDRRSLLSADEYRRTVAEGMG